MSVRDAGRLLFAVDILIIYGLPAYGGGRRSL
jgi:hypothetical protein